MRLLINHLTRMHGGHICVAGVDLETRRHIRPILANEPLPFYLLARYGGPFEMARVVDLGSPRPVPQPPHVEDHVFVAARARGERPATVHEFWGWLEELLRPRLRDIFGVALRELGRGRWGTDLGQGPASLGLLRPMAAPALYLAPSRDGKRQVRLKLDDGEIRADASVTDLRLFGDDHATPDAARISAVAQAMADPQDVILGVGLTRKFRSAANAPYCHWLQVTNIHLRNDPARALG